MNDEDQTEFRHDIRGRAYELKETAGLKLLRGREGERDLISAVSTNLKKISPRIREYVRRRLEELGMPAPLIEKKLRRRKPAAGEAELRHDMQNLASCLGDFADEKFYRGHQPAPGSTGGGRITEEDLIIEVDNKLHYVSEMLAEYWQGRQKELAAQEKHP